MTPLPSPLRNVRNVCPTVQSQVRTHHTKRFALACARAFRERFRTFRSRSQLFDSSVLKCAERCAQKVPQTFRKLSNVPHVGNYFDAINGTVAILRLLKAHRTLIGKAELLSDEPRQHNAHARRLGTF